jgi:integrase
VFKRCQCRDEQGRRVKGCRKAHGSWAYAVDAGRDPKTGKRKQKVRSGYRTREEAEAARTKELAAMAAGTWTNDQGMTLGAWLDKWLDRLTARGRSPKTLANYRGHVRDLWKPQLGHLRLRDVRRAHIERALATLAEPSTAGRRGNVGRRVERRSASTIDGYRRTIRAALSAAREQELITVNPAGGRMDVVSRSATRDDELAVWQPEETARFLEHVASDRLSALYELAAYAGLRRAELCGLRWSDIDEDGAGLTVRQTAIAVTRNEVPRSALLCAICGREHLGRYFKPPKSRAGRRWVPLAGPARDALDRHRKAQQNERGWLGEGYSDHDLVFCAPDGTPLYPGAVTVAFEAHARACGLPVIRLHDTRHGACSLLIAGGVPIEVVQMILGHTSPAVTRKVYAHLMRKATAAQVESATELLTRLRQQQGSTAGTDDQDDDGAGTRAPA